MEEKYRVFAEKYNKMLDLVEIGNVKFVEKYQNYINKIPKSILGELNRDASAAFFNNSYDVTLDYCGEMLLFDMCTFEPEYNVMVCLNPYTLPELKSKAKINSNGSNDGIFIFSIKMSNTTEEPEITFHYLEQNNEYKLTSVDTVGKVFEFQMFVQQIDKDFYLVSKVLYNYLTIKTISKKVPFDLLKQYATVAGCENNSTSTID